LYDSCEQEGHHGCSQTNNSIDASIAQESPVRNVIAVSVHSFLLAG
jgi:hypothetical protein